jgi:hypothetical protein
MFHTPNKTVKRSASRKPTKRKHLESLANDIQSDSHGSSMVISERTTLFTQQQTSSVVFAQPAATQSFTMPTSLNSLGIVSTQHNNVVAQNEPNSAVEYYELGIILAGASKPGQALLSLYQAWNLGLTPSIQLKDLPILQQLYASLMPLISHMQKIVPQNSPELKSFIAQATFFNDILLQNQKGIVSKPLQRNVVPLSHVMPKPLTLPIPSVAVTSSPFFSARKPTAEIINVSGFGNNCGLYALALGIKKFLAVNHAVSSQTKEIFNAMDELSLIRSTPLTETIGKELRQYLFNAVSLDEEFKTNRRENFIAYVVTQLAGKEEIPMDMLAFHLANQHFFDSLKIQWVELLETLPEMSIVWNQVRELEKKCRAIKVTDEQIAKLIPQVKKHFSRIKLTHKAIENFINQIWVDLSTQSLVEKIVSLRKIFSQINFAEILGEEIEQGQKNALFKEQLTRFVDDQIVRYLLAIVTEQEQYKRELICYALLSDYSLEGRIKVVRYDINKTICRYFVEQQLFDQYATIYNNYCTYLREQLVMLTADELGCLATYFGVRVTIKFPDGNHYQSSEQVNLPQIILCNPTQDHWQVIVQTPVALRQSNLNMLADAALLTSNEEAAYDLADITTESESTEDENSMDMDEGIRFSIHPT